MTIRSDDPRILLTGRIDKTDPRAPVFIWQGTQARLRFTGTGVAAVFDRAVDRNFYTVFVDGKESLLRLEEGGPREYGLADGLSGGLHDVLLFKRSEALFGTAQFLGFRLPDCAAAGPAPRPLPRVVEFYGDSITAGACNGDPAADQYDDLSTHDNYHAYGALASRALGAEYSCIAVSGTGICASWNPVLMPEVFDKLRPDPASPRYAFDGREPDVVVINLGQNDFGFPNSNGEPFPKNFAPRYAAMVRGIRAVYPGTWIVCTIGGMTAYRESPDLQSAFTAATDGLMGSDVRIRRLVFRAESSNHPRIEVHEKLARELIDFLLENLPELSWPARSRTVL
jgi:hypothetical protein